MAHECLHNVKVEKKKALVLKLYLMKAYDKVNWDYMRLVLLQIGLSVEATG